MAAQLIPIVTNDVGNGINLAKAADNMENLDNFGIFTGLVSENTRKVYNKRLRDVVVDMVRLNYI